MPIFDGYLIISDIDGTLLDNGILPERNCEKIKYCNFENEKCNDINLIAISIEDIKGATINQFQSIDLLYLIGVNLK